MLRRVSPRIDGVLTRCAQFARRALPRSADGGSSRSGTRWERGQASVELIGAIPALLVAVLIAAQLVAAGHALWSAALAARAGARASVVGTRRRRRGAAGATGVLREGARIGEDDGVSVRVEVPRLLPGMPELRVGSRTSLGPGDG